MAGISTTLVLRSVRVGSTRFAAVAKPKKSPLHLPNQKPQSSLISRMPVEMSSAVMRTMLPFHTATASALLTSMLSVAPRFYIWTLEDS